jgi:hypothetical protein
MRQFCLISLLLLLAISCRHEAELPEVYEVTFCNRYFERLISVEIADNKFEYIETGNEVIIGNVPHGKQTVTVVTQSGLKIEAAVNLIGTNPAVRIVLIESGKLQME